MAKFQGYKIGLFLVFLETLLYNRYGLIAPGQCLGGVFLYMDSIKAIPLGGVGEIGKNMMLIEKNGRILIIDAGVMFPEDDLLGIDLVIPDISYLVENKERIDGMVLTHGHEDHIGAIPYIIEELDIPIYGTRLALGLVKAKLKEFHLSREVKFKEVAPRKKTKIGTFEVELIRVNHSIADTCALAIKTPYGPIIYASDFKFDQTPVDGIVVDYHKLSQYGDSGVLALFSDSTNAEREGFTNSERVVGEKIDDVFSTARGRIIVATFASNIHRIQQVFDAARRYRRKVAITGRSMVHNCQIASELGYLDIPEDSMVELRDLPAMDHDKIAILTTGSQGEPLAALTRMANGEPRQVNVCAGDTVMVSASPIPGNERLVGETINKLYRLGADVIYQAISGVHVSGHASKEELKLMCNLVRPRYFIPVHGEYRHLYHHAQLAENMGIERDNIFVLEPGSVLELNSEQGKIKGNVGVDRVLVDGLGIGDVGTVVLRDRRLLSQDGILIVVMTIDRKNGQMISGPDIVTRGFVYMRESEELIQQATDIVERTMEKCLNNGEKQWSRMKNRVRDALSGFVYQKIKRRPMILPIIMEI